jgi:hypothetical protein
MKRLVTVLLLVVAGLAASSTAASARPLPELCVRYVDPIHMGSYDYCPLG